MHKRNLTSERQTDDSAAFLKLMPTKEIKITPMKVREKAAKKKGGGGLRFLPDVDFIPGVIFTSGFLFPFFLRFFSCFSHSEVLERQRAYGILTNWKSYIVTELFFFYELKGIVFIFFFSCLLQRWSLKKSDKEMSDFSA